ncbi:hypothetical protein B8W67_19275 [Mycolicibacillus koreensis]|uniref:ESX secretion-associated protein EspG n=2 Tax=Mycolicibacillus koreensis TaxID=1069220 RepID=A0AA91PB07_9MYCO|nr:hypothetical protein B8W67_19275 [Mycolicibacillus koreensis]
MPPSNLATLADRLDHGDLRPFCAWLDAYVPADIWVECRVNYISEDPDIRMLAYRVGQSGFFAVQRRDEDVVDVFALSPYELGAAVAAAAEMRRPGVHPKIFIPGLLDDRRVSADAVGYKDDDEYEYTPVRVAAPRRSGSLLSPREVTVMTTVQSRCRPARTWGVDWGREAVVCLRIEDDGDYVYTPDFEHAVPVTTSDLARRTDQMISRDVAVLRHERNLD